MKKYEVNKKIVAYYIFMLIYLLLGIVTVQNLYTLESLADFYFLTYPYISVSYLIFGCLFYKHKKIIFYLVDIVMCTALILLPPMLVFPPIFIYIYVFNEHLYYLLGACFSFLPLVYSYFDEEEINYFHIIKIITRIMIICLIVLALKACQNMPLNIP